MQQLILDLGCSDCGSDGVLGVYGELRMGVCALAVFIRFLVGSLEFCGGSPQQSMPFL